MVWWCPSKASDLRRQFGRDLPGAPEGSNFNQVYVHNSTETSAGLVRPTRRKDFRDTAQRDPPIDVLYREFSFALFRYSVTIECIPLSSAI